MKLFGTTKNTVKIEADSVLINISENQPKSTDNHQKTKPNENEVQKTIPPYKKEEIHERIETLIKKLTEGLYEKDEAVRLALLCAVAGESIFFLGKPGTAKSMISRRIQKAFKGDTKYFEYLMNEFSTPDEIFGTIKLEGLDKGIYEKNTEGYLPQANVAFLDEIWKSGPAILNTLLTIINEKKFHNGNRVDGVPLQILLAASNELPKEKAGLEALYDRFIVRTMVNPVKSEDSFFDLCEKSGEEISVKEIENKLLLIEEVKSWQEKISEIILDDKIREVITQIRLEMERKNQEENRDEKEKFYVSDRRWKKIVHILKTSAFLCGRNAVDLMDCQLITYCIWNTAKQREEVQEIVEEIVQQHGLDCVTAIEDIENEIDAFENYINSTFYEEIKIPALYEMNDGHKAYKLVKPTTFNSNGSITPHYISTEDVFGRSDRIGAYYDANKNIIGNYNYCIDPESLKENNETIFFKDWYRYCYNGYDEPHSLKVELKTQKGKFQKSSEIFKNPNILEPVQKEANEKHYQPLADSIKKELLSLEDFRSVCEKPFTENLFADSTFKNAIFTKIEAEKQKLEDAKVNLDKQRNRYEE